MGVIDVLAKQMDCINSRKERIKLNLMPEIIPILNKLEREYGSVSLVPENNEDLIKIHKIVSDHCVDASFSNVPDSHRMQRIEIIGNMYLEDISVNKISKSLRIAKQTTLNYLYDYQRYFNRDLKIGKPKYIYVLYDNKDQEMCRGSAKDIAKAMNVSTGSIYYYRRNGIYKIKKMRKW